ncbi:hypothetical protein IWX90DRAFT_442680 [Phyllosticta citrichinensis]|uniref:Uncharacterized protein n=1 Tax=Phyllosticta citrichinensis TaxID=1130410 RepID=A0ABR1XHU5_9PEZI
MSGTQDPPQPQATTPPITLHAPYATTPPTKPPPSSTAAAAAAAAAPSPPPPPPPPSPAFLAGTWHVTHSTLPMWSSKRNVTITYTPLASTDPVKLDDLVEYAPANGPADKRKSIHGVDAPAQLGHDHDHDHGDGWAWDWRGKGWLKIASSRWEVLGYGDEEEIEAGEGNQWVVTFFASTLFTPAGIDIYSRRAGGLRPDTVSAIKSALQSLGAQDVAQLAGKLFEISR